MILGYVSFWIVLEIFFTSFTTENWLCALFIYLFLDESHSVALADLELGICTELVLNSRSSALAGREVGGLGI